MTAAQVASGDDMMTPDETFSFASLTPSNFSELLNRTNGNLTDVPGYLFLPKSAEGRVPVVFVSIGSRGFESGREALYANALTEAGFAVFIGDSFEARGFAETRTDQSRLSAAGTCSDALFALKALAAHPRIDAQRAAVLGYSRGGTVAALLADERLQACVLPDGLRYAAHVALYPSCSPQWINPQPTSAPVIMLLGGADEMAPPGKAKAYADKMTAAGANVDVRVFPGLHHSFDARHPVKRGKGMNMADTVMLIDDDGNWFEETTGLRGTDWAPFYRDLAQKRGRDLSVTGNGPSPRNIAVAPIVEFLRKTLNV